jgi:hypothetical protein
LVIARDMQRAARAALIAEPVVDTTFDSLSLYLPC